MAVKKGLPSQWELVTCTVKRISQFAAWCNLDEYQNREGMIHISEIAGKWIHDIKKYVKLEKQYVAKVIKIDENSINLSLKRVSKSEERGKRNEFRKEQRAEGILKIIAVELKIDLGKAYETIGFPLQEKFGDLYSGFEEIKKSSKNLSKLNIPEKWEDPILKVIEKTFVEKTFVLKSELQLYTYESDGIERIKKVLKILEKDGIGVNYISAPKYRLEKKTKNPKLDTKKFQQQIENAIAEASKISVEAGYKLES